MSFTHVGGRCDVCNRETGNLARHRPRCAERNGEPVSTTNLTDADRALVLRAGCHARAEALLEPESRLRGGVTDLDVARVLLALERGDEIVAGARPEHWRAPGGSPLQGLTGQYARRPLPRVVNEMIRLGLAYVVTDRVGPAIWKTYVAPALVHKRDERFPLRPACGRPVKSIKRYRLVDDLTLVDCQGCVDVSR